MGDLSKLNATVQQLGADIQTLIATQSADDQAEIDAVTSALAALDNLVTSSTPTPPTSTTTAADSTTADTAAAAGHLAMYLILAAVAVAFLSRPAAAAGEMIAGGSVLTNIGGVLTGQYAGGGGTKGTFSVATPAGRNSATFG